MLHSLTLANIGESLADSAKFIAEIMPPPVITIPIIFIIVLVVIVWKI